MISLRTSSSYKEGQYYFSSIKSKDIPGGIIKILDDIPRCAFGDPSIVEFHLECQDRDKLTLFGRLN
jgi:hypothetical protein